jgi:hypothetical protein
MSMSSGSPVPTAMLYAAGGSTRRNSSIAALWATQLSSNERFVVKLPAAMRGQHRQMSAGEMFPTSIRPLKVELLVDLKDLKLRAMLLD